MSLPTPDGYKAFDEASLPTYLASSEALASRLGGTPNQWKVREVGDGNLNLVFIVEGPAGDVCVKQALPYVRLVGEGWPLPLQRAFFEHEATRIHAQFVGDLVPEILHWDPSLFLIVMERLSPHIIMRQGMVKGTKYPNFAGHVTDYLARALFHTSDLDMPAGEKKQAVATFCGNTELCRITEDLIFTDPYMIHERNRWTSPQLDELAEAIRDDNELKQAVSRLKILFLTRAEALLHGDLHTGSVMITDVDTRIIDPEFAFYGPMGFDVGKLIGNFLLSYFSQAGHEQSPGARDDYRSWILQTVEEIWTGFEQKFVKLWSAKRGGDAYPVALLAGSGMRDAQNSYMRELFSTSLGFAGCSMIRRTLGLAHNIDMEWIDDPDRRADCERRNLLLAVELIKGASKVECIQDVTARAAEINQRI